jgi:hypothetical protein
VRVPGLYDGGLPRRGWVECVLESNGMNPAGVLAWRREARRSTAPAPWRASWSSLRAARRRRVASSVASEATLSGRPMGGDTDDGDGRGFREELNTRLDDERSGSAIRRGGRTGPSGENMVVRWRGAGRGGRARTQNEDGEGSGRSHAFEVGALAARQVVGRVGRLGRVSHACARTLFSANLYDHSLSPSGAFDHSAPVLCLSAA